jgi:hypothetical protein
MIEALMIRLIRYYTRRGTATQYQANEAIHADRFHPDLVYSAWYALEHGDQNGYKWLLPVPRTHKSQKRVYQINPHLETDDSALERAGLLRGKNSAQ